MVILCQFLRSIGTICFMLRIIMRCPRLMDLVCLMEEVDVQYIGQQHVGEAPQVGNLRRHKDMVANDWEELDLMVMCVVRVHLVDNASFTFYDNGFIEKLRTKLCNTYEKVIASNKVCLMRRLHDLCTKHSNIYASHLNNFDALQPHLQIEKMIMHIACQHQGSIIFAGGNNVGLRYSMFIQKRTFCGSHRITYDLYLAWSFRPYIS